MRRSTYTESANGVADAQLSVDSSLANRGLPNRLMTAFEVAGVRRLSRGDRPACVMLRGLLTSQRFGVRSRRFHPADVLDWIKRGAPTRSRKPQLMEAHTHEGGQMAIRRRCNGRTCKKGRRCLDHLWFDVMYRGQRCRMTVNEFAVPRMEVGKQRPIESMEEARDWERLFIGGGQAGRDPRRPRTPRKATDVAPQGRRRASWTRLRRAVRQAGGTQEREVVDQPRRSARRRTSASCRSTALEDADDINRFKTDSDYAEEVEIATLHRALETLRAAMNWGMAQTPPFFKKSPFHRYGVRMNKKAETMRGSAAAARRGEAAARRRAAEDEHVGASVRRTAAPRPHHRRAGAVLPARRDAADPEQARELGDVPDRHPRRDRQGQGEPANSRSTRRDGSPRSSNAERRSDPTRYVFGSANGACTSRNIQTAWETLRLLAHGIEPRPTRKGAAWNREAARSGSISAGTTCGTKAPAGCWPTASTSASSS